MSLFVSPHRQSIVRDVVFMFVACRGVPCRVVAWRGVAWRGAAWRVVVCCVLGALKCQAEISCSHLTSPKKLLMGVAVAILML